MRERRSRSRQVFRKFSSRFRYVTLAAKFVQKARARFFPRQRSGLPAAAATRAGQKRPGARAGPWQSAWRCRLLARRDLRQVALERLVGLLGDIGVEFADLGRLGDKAFVGGLHVVGLPLACLFQRLGTHQPLDRGGAILERLLRVVGHLGRNRLQPLGGDAERAQRGLHIVLPELLHFVEVCQHGQSFELGHPAGSPGCLSSSLALMTSVTTHYSALHKKVKEIFAVHNLDFPEIAVNTLAIPAPYGRRLYHQQDGTARSRGAVFPAVGAAGRQRQGRWALKPNRARVAGDRGICCVFGSEPRAGFVGEFSRLRLRSFWSRSAPMPPMPAAVATRRTSIRPSRNAIPPAARMSRPTRPSWWTPIPAASCTPQMRTTSAIRRRSPRS